MWKYIILGFHFYLAELLVIGYPGKPTFVNPERLRIHVKESG